jgi:hypothetical protein
MATRSRTDNSPAAGHQLSLFSETTDAELDDNFFLSRVGGEGDGLRVIDLGSAHASNGETLGGRILAALKSESRLNDSVGASYAHFRSADIYSGRGRA